MPELFRCSISIYIHMPASFGCSISIYSVVFCFEFELLMVNLCWFALFQWSAEKGWPVMYFILLPHLPALFVTSPIDCWVQTGGTLDCIVFCRFQTWFSRAGWEIKWTLLCACFYFIPVSGTCGASLAWFPFKWALSDFYDSNLLSSSCPYCIWKPVFEGHRHAGNVKLQLYITVTSNPSSINFP